MKDPVNDFLKQARPPEWPQGHWDTFPQRIRRKLSLNRAAKPESTNVWLGGKLGFALAMAIGFAFLAGFYVRPKVETDWRTADSEKVIREMKQLFPDRIRSITINKTGMHLQIADSETVPNTQAILLRICDRTGDCEKIITFSGQTVEVDGRSMEALVTANGDVLLVGQNEVWSSTDKQARGSSSVIQAKALEVKL